MLQRVCAYCRETIGNESERATLDTEDLPREDLAEEEFAAEELVSHGVCRPCLEELVRGKGQPLEDYLESLNAPIFVVSGEGRMVGANSYARSLVATQPSEIEGLLGGEVFGCSYRNEPGGCGNSIHCQSCAIRLSVMETYETGRPHVRREACQDLDTFEGARQVRFLISTEKAGEGVLLRIDDAQVVDEEAG